MGQSIGRRLLLSWLVLTVITLLAWWMAARHGTSIPRPDAAVALAAIAITAVKVRVILREFMDVRHGPLLLRRLTDAWLGTFAAAMLIAYFA